MSWGHGEPPDEATPEKKLWCAVLDLMLVDFCYARAKKDKVLMNHMLRSLDSNWLEFICDSAGLHPDWIKAHFKNEMKRLDQSQVMKVDLRKKKMGLIDYL